MLCLKKRRTYSFTQGVCSEHPRRTKKESTGYGGGLNSAITTLPRKNRSREERPSGMVLTVTEDTPADMLAGSMELLVQLPREHHLHTQKVTVQRSTPMMDLLVQIATAHKLAASSYTLQAIGERGLVLPHQPNTPIGALDALQVKLLPKQGTFVPRKTKQANQPFETTFRLQVHLPRNQLYVSRVSPKMNLGEILDEVCREKNLDRSKYELRHPANLEETLDLSLSLQDYHLQEVTLYAKQGRSLGSALSTQDIMALQRQEERRRQQAKQGVFGFIFKKSKEGSLSTDSFGGRSTSPARSDETARSTSPLQPPARPQRKRRPAPKPPAQNATAEENAPDSSKDKVVISHSRNSSDSSGYHEASVLSDNPDSAGRLPETLPRRNRAPGAMETPRKLAQTSQSSKSLGNLATVSGTLTHAISSTSLSSTGLRKKRAAPPPPVSRPLSSAISSQALERIVDSEESLTSDMDPSKPPSDIGASSKACSDIEDRPKASSDIGVSTVSQMSSQSIESKLNPGPLDSELKTSTPPPEPPNPIPPGPVEVGQPEVPSPPEAVAANLEHCTPATRLTAKRDPLVGPPPQPMPRKANVPPRAPKRRLAPLSTASRASSSEQSTPNAETPTPRPIEKSPDDLDDNSSDDVFLTPCADTKDVSRFTGLTDGKASLSEPPDVPRTPIDKDDVKHSNSNDDSTGPQASMLRKAILIESPKPEKKVCAVISTLPKCEHLDDQPGTPSHVVVAKHNEKNSEKERRMKIYRMPSKSDDFETNSLERQKRHLTSHPEDITFALNLNLSANVDLTGEINDSMVKQDQNQANARLLDSGITADVEPGPLDTDVLLQKVSDTLSSSLPLDEKQANPPQSETKIPQEKAQSKPVSHKESENREKEVSGQINQDTTDSSEGVPLNNSTGSGTATSQQDTSDYVSAVDGDLSIPDWEYQLPAPPSAFRDTTSPAFDEYDTITLGSVEAFKEPIAVIVDDDRAESKKSSPRESSNKITSEKPEKSEKEEKPVKNLKKSDSSMELKKEVICELENKIGSGTLPQGIRESDSRKVDNLSTPRVAPVDNTLANFTITTYSRPKNVNIFDEVDHSASKKTSDDRFMKSFPTLARNRTNYESDARGKEASATMQRSKAEYVSLNDVELRKPEPKTEEVSQKWQSVKSTTEKVSVQRSRSYISSSERHAVHENDAKSDDGGNMGGHVDMRKATSTANLASVPKGNEKFSQWRENILKRQEEPTKEKQLQSLQVLKSILPQLKSAQQPEENVSKESSEAVLTEKSRTETGSNERSVEPNVVSTRESQKPNEPTAEVESNKAPEGKQLKKYTYSGPPAISLGSWSERPTVNVQIKKDTDYKFGGVHKTIGGRTIVNLNGMKDERVNAEVPKSDRTAENLPNKQEIISDKKSPSDLAKKLITHTTASGFKKPVLNRVSVEARPVDKPVVTGVELKKTFAEKNEANKNNDSTIDTSPVNFRELSRAFGQDVCLRPKPKRLNPNRRTEHFDSNPESLQKLDSLIKQNGHCDIPNGHSTGPEVKPKRFTSVVGITQNNSQTTNFPFRSGVSVKSNNAAMPVVKGFKMSSAKTNEPQKITNGTSGVAKSIPKPPTMPVITGVTLKSARPKSMPVQIDPRDMLLESIRSFGGRENLKSASGRC